MPLEENYFQLHADEMLAIRYNKVGDPHRCFYCGLRFGFMDLPKKKRLGSYDLITRDHIHPKCMGGKETVPSCRKCNHQKGSHSLNEFRALRYGGKPVEFFGEVVIRKAAATDVQGER